MSLTKRNGPLNPLPKFFDDLFSRNLFNWNTKHFSNTNTTIPSVNILETPETFEVEVAAPGMTKNDFKVELDGTMLTISSESTANAPDSANKKYTLREFSYQSFQRTFNLEKSVVDVENIQAKYDNGILHLLIPKKEEAKVKPPRLIQVS